MRFPKKLIQEYVRPVTSADVSKSSEIDFILSSAFEVAKKELDGFNDALPKPYGNQVVLSNKEEYELFLKFNYSKYRASLTSTWKPIRTWLAKAAYYKAVIAYHNLKLAYKQTHRLSMDAPEELEGEALFALNKAIDKFDVDKGFKFSTFATRVIYTEIMNNRRDTRKHKHAILITEGGDSYIDTRRNDERAASARMDIEDMVFNNPRISSRDLIVISKLFGLKDEGCCRQTDLAIEFGISKQGIDMLKKRVFKRVREKYEQITADEAVLHRRPAKTKEAQERARIKSAKNMKAMKRAEALQLV